MFPAPPIPYPRNWRSLTAVSLASSSSVSLLALSKLFLLRTGATVLPATPDSNFALAEPPDPLPTPGEGSSGATDGVGRRFTVDTLRTTASRP
ncbi:hypothetical protein CSPX01_04856 [Colletotrichum filicis]|nr:hypothetical protein CSPX01_04856 [Colletotrichum filicis]